jgi:hypothetical protein
MPGGWVVFKSDIDKFLDRYATAAAGAPVPARGPVAARRHRELDLVDRRLEALGLGMDPSDPSGDEEADR